MDQYARKECDNCHIVLPANQMFQRSGSVVVGRSDSVSKQQDGWRYGHYYQGRPAVNTTTTHYRTRTYWLCWACEERRRAKVRAAVRKFIALSLLGGIALIILAVTRDRLPERATIRSASQASNGVVSAAEAANGPIADTTILADPEQPRSNAETSNALLDQGSDADTMLSQLPRMLASEIEKALRKNETRLWHVNGMRGYVVLSNESSAATTCKNVVITLIIGQDQRQTTPQKWCQSSDGENWSPS